MFLIDWLMSHLTFLPNWLDASFDVLSSNWLGILSVSVLGPILEELLFRGAITKILLKKYKPAKAIILSGLIFGIFHLNPVQVVVAALVGFVFAWMYYKTKSLLPGIVMHIVNNSTSVYLATKYPDVDYLNELSGDNYTLYLGIAMALMILLVLYMEKLMAHKKRENANIIN
jgi:membrane protease YdiL (CAAX protease family)